MSAPPPNMGYPPGTMPPQGYYQPPPPGYYQPMPPPAQMQPAYNPGYVQQPPTAPPVTVVVQQAPRPVVPAQTVIVEEHRPVSSGLGVGAGVAMGMVAGAALASSHSHHTTHHHHHGLLGHRSGHHSPVNVHVHPAHHHPTTLAGRVIQARRRH
ncbi:unnamed protein product [Ixodes pacificus]